LTLNASFLTIFCPILTIFLASSPCP